MSDTMKQLRAPFLPDKVSWRVGSTTADKKRGMALAYIDARDVMDRLDDVVGPERWQCRYPHANGKTVCEIGIKLQDEWIWKADGAGDTDFEAEKGALSDSFKRSAVRWGIGRYLYDLDSPWVEIEPAGKSFKIKGEEFVKLRKLLGANTRSVDDTTFRASSPNTPLAPEQDAKRKLAEAYVRGAKIALANARTEKELTKWVNDEAENRAKYNIVLCQGTLGKDLYEEIEAHRAQLRVLILNAG